MPSLQHCSVRGETQSDAPPEPCPRLRKKAWYGRILMKMQLNTHSLLCKEQNGMFWIRVTSPLIEKDNLDVIECVVSDIMTRSLFCVCVV